MSHTPCPEAPPISPSPGPQTCRSISMCIPHHLEAWRASLTQCAQPYPRPISFPHLAKWHLVSLQQHSQKPRSPFIPVLLTADPALSRCHGAPSQTYLEPDNPIFPPPALLPAPGHLRSLLGSSHLARFLAPNRAPLGLHPKPLYIHPSPLDTRLAAESLLQGSGPVPSLAPPCPQ